VKCRVGAVAAAAGLSNLQAIDHT